MTSLSDALHSAMRAQHLDRGGIDSDGMDHVIGREANALADTLERLYPEGLCFASHGEPLPESAPSRKGGADTSRAAAESIDNLSDRQFAVWWLLDFVGPSTDEELTEKYGTYVAKFPNVVDANIVPKQTPQSIRTRRSELVKAGHVHPTGEKRLTSNGRQARVWAAREVEAVAA